MGEPVGAQPNITTTALRPDIEIALIHTECRTHNIVELENHILVILCLFDVVLKQIKLQ